MFYIVDYAANKEEPDYTLLRYEAMIEVRLYVCYLLVCTCVLLTRVSVSRVHTYSLCNMCTEERTSDAVLSSITCSG